MMTFPFYFVVAIFFSFTCTFVKAWPPPLEASPEAFPFHAFVKGTQSCNGILISPDYVLTPAYCVYGAQNLTVFLGFRGYPYYVANHAEPNVQILYTDKCIIHEKFTRIGDGRYLNNIALVKLLKPASLSRTVQPGKLITKEESQHLVNLNISGWMLSTNTELKVAQAKLRSQHTCSALFGKQFFDDQENCIEWFNSYPLNLLGNAVSSNGKIVGYQTNTPPCVEVGHHKCSHNDMVLNIVPFIDWISERAHLPFEETHHQKYFNNINEKVEKFHDIIKEVKAQQQSDVADLKKKLDELIVSLQTKSTQDVNYGLKLDEQASDLRSEITNNDLKHNASILKLQEEIRDSKTEISDGLAAQRAQYENLAKLIEALGKNSQEEDRLVKIESALWNIRTETETNKFNIQELSHKFLQGISSLKDKLNLLQPSNHHHHHEMHLEDLDHKLSLSLRNISYLTEYRLSQLDSDIENLYGTIKQLKLKEEEIYTRVHQELLHMSSKSEEALWKIQTRTEVIEKALHENTNNFNKQIVENQQSIATILRSLRQFELRVKNCCLNEDYGGFDSHH